MNKLLDIEELENTKMFRSDIIADKIYILCAAIWFKDGKIYKYQPQNVDNGFVVCGRRHSNCYTTAWIVNKGETEYLLETNDRVIEGFLTSDDQFVDRKKGGEIAFSAKQTKILKSCLLAEDLY